MITTSDDFNLEQLRDQPTLFYERLRRFLSDDDAMRVVEEIASICQRCWNEDADCECGGAKPKRRLTQG